VPRADALSPFGMKYLGGLLHHAMASTVLANPTINGYRRFRANSLAPDRVSWGTDHRGGMFRVLGGAGDLASRIENSIVGPSAHPYLYIASQLITGLDGVDNSREPGPPHTDPYTADHKMLPKTLGAALELFEREPLFTNEFGKIFVEYYVRIKRTELQRYE